MSSPNPRKRPASGAPPMVHPQLPPSFSAVQPEQLFRWNSGADGNGFADSGSPGVNSFAMLPTAGSYGQAIPAPSTALARRQNSRALVSSGSRPPFPGTDNWKGYSEDGNYLPATAPAMDEHDNIERLEEMAQRAKRDAQAKRKQIPPFVQKLSSFLDESRNTELIRWSDKGDSFVVLDEDEFAKTLIPELFKHNNYASFVRQLNMYGFHKRVGLSDNSMKASERKNKSPSEYYNPYFRRGHPNLLWLINKPKSGSSKKKGKKDDGEAESEEDGGVEETYSGQNLAAPPVGRGPVSSEVGPLQKKDLVQVRGQIERIQQQQLAISNMLSKMRQDQNQLYQQAVLFQNMHERHENSINAILNFLANVFRKSLEEQGGAQSVQDLLASIIPNAQGHGQSQMAPTGGVVDLAGFFNQRPPAVTTVGTPKRQPRLLPPIPHHQTSKVGPMPTSPTPSPALPTSQGPQMGTVTELFDTPPADTTSPAYIESELRSNPQEGMMRFIQDTNAVNTSGGISGIDLPDVAAKTSASMSDDQRTKMLNIMAGGGTPTTPHHVASNDNPVAAHTQRTTTALPQTASSVPRQRQPPPPPQQQQQQQRPNLSLSPDLPPFPLPPALHEIQATQAELDELQRLQNQQASQIDELTSLLGPLSPSGRIPGLDEHGNPNTSYFDNVDYDQFINDNAFADPAVGNYDAAAAAAAGGGFDALGAGLHPNHHPHHHHHHDADVGGEGAEFDFSLDGTADGYGVAPQQPQQGGVGGGGGFESGRVFETGSGANTPSPAGTEEIMRTDFGESPERGAKRQRRV
ncbi:hypothetical protein BT67DRAFT_65697 [Trichocladium antarcticum]|uniref:HSF-type DNA-binding domain-containing protein n=1 Tax=Trichocladium antarcticum TaxID=1450529 RepID=A0AAN6UHJ5_9PEZI|nr:hypothetical protein BT67DRAFT_65697 [Trichocladium antarcticum]